MNNLALLSARYSALFQLAKYGVELVSIGDQTGQRLDSAVKNIIDIVKSDENSVWHRLAASSKLLRWHRMTRPIPNDLNVNFYDKAEAVIDEATNLRLSVADVALLDELIDSIYGVAQKDSPVGEILLESLQEIGSTPCIVVAANSNAKKSLSGVLKFSNVKVMTQGELVRKPVITQEMYVVGPPSFFHSSLWTSPLTDSIHFLYPSWYKLHELPGSVLSEFAFNSIEIRSHLVYDAGDVEAAACQDNSPADQSSASSAEDYIPQPIWAPTDKTEPKPQFGHRLARKAFLAGAQAIWLDHRGRSIRAVDPDQPEGDRVSYLELAQVQRGTYLLLGMGKTQEGEFYNLAIAKLEEEGQAIARTQAQWKARLRERLDSFGNDDFAIRNLRNNGIKTAHQARAWTDPYLSRPGRESDFILLLDWLGLPREPFYDNAMLLSTFIRAQIQHRRWSLEKSVSSINLSELEERGYLLLEDPELEDQSLLATKVLAISPKVEAVKTQDLRKPFKEEYARWLE